jgi:glucose/arabinose dehydrogenase
VLLGGACLALAVFGIRFLRPDPRRGSDIALRQCERDNGGMTLPQGFCSAIFADGVGTARHLVVAGNGDVFVALDGPRGGVLALRDTNGDGRADVREMWGGPGGSGIALGDGMLYTSTASTVRRWRLPAGSLRPEGPPDTIVDAIPRSGHASRSLALDGRGSLFVNVGSESNVCELQGARDARRGPDPCVELDYRAGIWRFDANGHSQRQMDCSSAAGASCERFATGIRNAVGLTVSPVDGRLYATQHGRDALHQHWPQMYSEEQGAEKPSEILVRVERGDDFGWPYCYHDLELGRLVLAPEYGGDGRQAGRCAGKKEPLVAFPGHWAPNGLLFYTGTMFPPHYRNGAFVTFHGSWNRAPLPQAGYRVAFVPFERGEPAGPYETFADGLQKPSWRPGSDRRPVGLAQGPDGALFVTEDNGGRIWRVVFSGSWSSETRIVAPRPVQRDSPGRE